ncbi:MAG TPA: hypothetical protein VJU77_15625 [Chthoniobacterales bacterium]|nr:hypothetical protein [Chthoniobacterales bacterium]
MVLIRSLFLTLIALVAAESGFGATPEKVRIVVVPSPLDELLVPAGNVELTYSDGRRELLTTDGHCLDARLSARGVIGWIHMENFSLDPDTKRRNGNIC